jgi:hypothetical protein
VGTAANKARATKSRNPIFEPGSTLNVIAHSSNQDLRQSKLLVARGGSRTLHSGGFLGPREKNSTTQFANGHPHYPSSVLRRTTLSKPVRGRNRFLTIEGSRLERCYIPYPCAGANSKREIGEVSK